MSTDQPPNQNNPHCPTCGDEFESGRAMKIHHTKAHGESLAGFEKTCQNCGEEFTAEERKAEYCSQDCFGESRRNRETTTCGICGEEFEAAQSADRKYCSQSCYYKAESKDYIELKCEQCGTEFERPPSESDRKYCSQECHINAHQVTLACNYCGDEFTVRKAKEYQEYCSRGCAKRARVKKKQEKQVCVSCSYCGADLMRQPLETEDKEEYYCSEYCRRGETEIHACAHCGDDVRVTPSEQDLENHYCDMNCFSEGAKNRETAACEQCGADIERPPSGFKYDTHFCSQECLNEHKRTGEYRECTNCGERVYTIPAREEKWENIFCSQDCRQEYYTGENHPSYTQLTVKCWNCETKLSRKRWRVNNTKRHFCNIECEGEWMKWAGKDPNDPVPDKDYPRWENMKKQPPQSQAEYLELSLADNPHEEVPDDAE